MTEQLFKDGSVVRLKSGGPNMTVVGYAKYGMAAIKESYLCKWFDEKNKVVQDTFKETELELVANVNAGTVLSYTAGDGADRLM
jgi:uncharacterized protein YodC (DUF2158 family)